jgi:hypothetical protein
MPDLDHQLRTYFDALADEIDDAALPIAEFRGGSDVVLIGSDAQPIELADERALRRPRALLAVAAVALALGVAGVIAWVADDAPLSVDVDTADIPTTTTPEVDGVEAEIGVGGSLVVVDELLYPGPDHPFNGGFSVPWKGGTLTLETVRVLGPPPDDVLNRYPPEIQELWADGLPTTWEQAESELQAAGLGQLGFETAENDLVLREWFLGSTGVSALSHTVGGVSVETVAFEELDVPLRDVQSIDSDGERLAVAGMGEGPYGVVAVTDDLRTWTTHVWSTRPQRGRPMALCSRPTMPRSAFPSGAGS